MKRLTSFMLTAVLALSLLSSCGGDAPKVSGAPSGASGTGSASPAPETSSAPEANYLADPMFDTDEYLPDYDETCIFKNSQTFSSMCETDTACYGIQRYNRLMFWDRQTGISGPLCGKPECDHDPDTLTCNARIQSGFDVSFYDGKIWFWSSDPTNWSAPKCLWSVNPDGTSRQKVLELDEASEFNSDFHVYPHRGYVYCSGTVQLTVDGVPSERLHMFAKALDTGETVEILDCTYPQSADLHYSIQWSGNNLYILKKANAETEIFRWDSKTRTLESLYFTDSTEISFVLSDIGISEDGKTLYIAASYYDNTAYVPALYELDLESRTLTRAFTMDEMGNSIGMVFGKVYVIRNHSPKTDDDSPTGYWFVKDLDSGDVLYQGFDLPEGIEQDDVSGLVYSGGTSENLYFHMMLKNGRQMITCLSLGDTPKMTVLWEAQ